MPWMNISVDPDGSIKPCCVSTQYITKENGDKFNLGYDKVEDIVNSSDFVKLRQDMLEGKYVEGCRRCYDTELLGDESTRRQMYNDRWINNPITKEKISQGTTIDTRVLDMDLRFGNLCNLACKSCNSTYSSQLTKELKELKHTEINSFYTVVDNTNVNDWYETEIFEHNINSQLENLSQLYITGGEPTIIKKNYDILDRLVSSGRSKEMRLVINSNMTNLNSKFYSLISEFENVTFYASIDGYGSLQEYIRYPSNWEQIDKNLRYLIDNFDNITLKPAPVIQLTNLNKIVELFEYFENFNRLANKPIVNMLPINLQAPNHLDCVYLPLDYKQECWAKIEEWMNTATYQDSNFVKKMQIIKNKCLTEVDYRHQLDRYFQMNDIFDNSRSFYLKDVNPELERFRLS
jgi:MoaA/NifB/PqqE/SkfB family radical SAM enzyme